MINSRNIDDLDPEAKDVCTKHILNCREEGIELIVTSTYRDYDSQDALYAIGRDGDPRRTVTNARAGQSWHNFKCAWDVVAVVSGKPVWDATDPIWKTIVQCGKDAGAEAGAEWKSFPDLPHFQYRPQAILTVEEAKARFDADGSIFTT